MDERRAGVLEGVRVLDLSHQYSGALAACLLADLGAEVVAVEHPGGSPIRTMLPRKGGQSLWWKNIQRGKKNITLDLGTETGRGLLLDLARHFDAMVENFRPGTLERWRIGPADLEAAGIAVVLLRISGFGQTGPARERPGFGTVAEAMSGFAYLNGFPDGPPVFPSTTLADGVAATFGALGVAAALAHRFRTGERRMEVIDLGLFEGLFRLIPTQVSGYDQLGLVPVRPGNFLGSHGVLRNLYRTADGAYFCVSAVGETPIRRVLAAAGAEPLVARLDAGAMHAAPEEVVGFLEECDKHLERWASTLPWPEADRRLREGDVPYQRIYTVADIVEDPHYRAREDLIRVDDRDLGSILMPGLVPKFPGRRHTVAHAGTERGADNLEVYGRLLGFDRARLETLRAQGVL